LKSGDVFLDSAFITSFLPFPAERMISGGGGGGEWEG
jgi:hypothetical protein